MSESRRTHWQQVYANKEPTEVSWYQPVPEKSLQLIRATGTLRSDSILDIGGGASTLIDHLLEEGYEDVSVLDVSAKALERSRVRLNDSAAKVCWIESDVTEFEPSRRYALCHDRAVFHFLTESADRDKYIDVICRALQPRGHFVLATFGPQGPLRCSGLEIRRYGIEQLQELLGAAFKLCHYELDDHRTPMGSAQQFLYSWWQAKWFLETERLVLRRITLEDAGLMLAVWNDPAFVRHVGDRGIRTIEQAHEALKEGAFKLYEDRGYGPYCMALKKSGTLVGICGLFQRDNLDDPDIGFAVLPDYCGKGLAGEAAIAVVAHARDDLGIERLTAIVSPENSASIGLIEKLGLTFERGITMPGEEDEISLYSMKLG